MLTLTTKKKTLAVSLSMAFMFTFTPANAGFLNDMYQEMSANANVQGPKIYETQRAGVITGGGMVWKTPRRNFQPIGFTPPHLRAGCGGVDLFMGSFSLFSKDEFVQMLRAVGQNMAGLLFHTALAAISPELDGLIRKFSKDVTDFNKNFKNSCETAAMLNNKLGLTKMAKELGEEARGFGTFLGIFNDRGEAEKETAGNGQKTYDNVPEKTNDDGKSVYGKQMNITWNVLNSGSFTGLSEGDKEIVMSMLGSVIVDWTADTGADKKLKPRFLAPLARENITKWIGSANDVNTTIEMKIYRCSDLSGADPKCLVINETLENYPGLAKTVHASLQELRDAIVQRRNPTTIVTASGNVNPMAIVAMTTIPVGNIVNLMTTGQLSYMADVVLKLYADAIAYDIGTRLMQEVVLEVEKAVKHYSDGVSVNASELATHRNDIQKVREDLAAMRVEVNKHIVVQQASIDTVLELEKKVYGNVARNVMNNIAFGRSVR